MRKLYAYKKDNLEEMDKFLERYSLPRLNQEEIKNMDRWLTSTEIETMIEKLSTNKSPGPKVFTSGELYQTCSEGLKPILLKLFPKKMQKIGNFQIHSMRPSSPWYQNQKNIYQKKKKITGRYHW